MKAALGMTTAFMLAFLVLMLCALLAERSEADFSLKPPALDEKKDRYPLADSGLWLGWLLVLV